MKNVCCGNQATIVYPFSSSNISLFINLFVCLKIENYNNDIVQLKPFGWINLINTSAIIADRVRFDMALWLYLYLPQRINSSYRIVEGKIGIIAPPSVLCNSLLLFLLFQVKKRCIESLISALPIHIPLPPNQLHSRRL